MSEKKEKKTEQKEFVEVFAFTKEGAWAKFGEIEVTSTKKKKFREPFIIKYKKSVLREK